MTILGLSIIKMKKDTSRISVTKPKLQSVLHSPSLKCHRPHIPTSNISNQCVLPNQPVPSSVKVQQWSVGSFSDLDLISFAFSVQPPDFPISMVFCAHGSQKREHGALLICRLLFCCWVTTTPDSRF